MAKVKNLISYKILDANGYWAVQAKLVLDTKSAIKASLPLMSDALVNPDDNWQMANKMIKQLNEIILPALMDLEIENDFALVADELLDQLKLKHKILSQTSLLTSILCARAGAKVNKIKLYKYLNQIYGLNQDIYNLPTPIFNMFNGGLYADTNLDFEEYLLIPLTKSKTSFTQKVFNASKVFQQLGEVLKKEGLDTDTGSEGGYAPDMTSSIKAIEYIAQAITESGFDLGKDMGIGLDIGSNRLYSPDQGKYIFKLDNSQFVNDTLINLYREWLEQYPIVYLEDGLNSHDKEGWQSLTNQLRDDMIIAGDHLFDNNIEDLRKMLKDRLANAAVIKLDKFRTLQDLIEFVKLAKKHNYLIVMSHSYGETTDSFLSDLAVGTGADYIKAGSLSRGERTVKYNRLLEIEQTLV
ncbi:MAG: hypothetical protein ABIG10_02975 [bacterium]